MRNAVAMTALALVTMLPQPIEAQEAKAPEVGLWLGESRTQGGLGNWMEFHADGTVELGFGALVGALLDDTYSLEGTTLRLRVFGGKTTSAGDPVFEALQKTVRIDGEHAVVEPQWPKDQPVPEIHSPAEQAALDRMRRPVRMTSVGPGMPGAPAIAGTWSYEHYTGHTAYETFTPGGKWYLRVPMRGSHGRYTVTTAGVNVQLGDQSQTFARTGNVLMSGPADGTHSTYRRAPE